jgi:hypothetical protein
VSRFNARIGKLTASQFHRIITPGGAPSGQRGEYAREKVAECVIQEVTHRRPGDLTAQMLAKLITPTGRDSSEWESISRTLLAEEIRPDQSASFDGNYDTDRGNALEPAARSTFAEIMYLDVQQTGFVTRVDGIVGCSPDGFIYEGDEIIAGLELKCPRAKAHAEYILNGELPSKYAPQVHGSMAVTGLRKWYFMSFCEGMRSFPICVEWDSYTDSVSAALDQFLGEYQDTWENLKDRLTSARDRFLTYQEERRATVLPMLVEGGVL